jgi:hypothetical protein
MYPPFSQVTFFLDLVWSKLHQIVPDLAVQTDSSTETHEPGAISTHPKEILTRICHGENHGGIRCNQAQRQVVSRMYGPPEIKLHTSEDVETVSMALFSLFEQASPPSVADTLRRKPRNPDPDLLSLGVERTVKYKHDGDSGETAIYGLKKAAEINISQPDAENPGETKMVKYKPVITLSKQSENQPLYLS